MSEEFNRIKHERDTALSQLGTIQEAASDYIRSVQFFRNAEAAYHDGYGNDQSLQYAMDAMIRSETSLRLVI